MNKRNNKDTKLIHISIWFHFVLCKMIDLDVSSCIWYCKREIQRCICCCIETSYL